MQILGFAVEGESAEGSILTSDMPANKRPVLMEYPVDGTFAIEQRCGQLHEHEPARTGGCAGGCTGGLAVETQVTTSYLELRSVEEFTPSTTEVPGLEIREAGIARPELGRFLYTVVGRAWRWTDRLSWPYSTWLAHLERPEVELWIAYQDGVIAGYVELERQPEGSVEIAYFGLLRQFMGRGIGGFLLSDTVERAFRTGAKRVWLHTCSLDSPQAMENYRARGFKLFKEETTLEDVPPAPPDAEVW
jgi:GNAT superfamily N-acetyltransferase